MMEPRICQDPVDIEFPLDSSILEESQDLMKLEMSMMQDTLMEPLMQDALMEPVMQDALIESVMQDALMEPVMQEVTMEPGVREVLVKPVIPEVQMEPVVPEDLFSCGGATSTSAQVLLQSCSTCMSRPLTLQSPKMTLICPIVFAESLLFIFKNHVTIYGIMNFHIQWRIGGPCKQEGWGFS